MMDRWKIALLRPRKVDIHSITYTCVLWHNSNVVPLKNLCFKQLETTTEKHLHNSEMHPGHFEHYFQIGRWRKKKNLIQLLLSLSMENTSFSCIFHQSAWRQFYFPVVSGYWISEFSFFIFLLVYAAKLPENTCPSPRSWYWEKALHVESILLQIWREESLLLR